MKSPIEYESLREEIKESDKICIFILGYSFTISAGILSLNDKVDTNIGILVLLVQVLWTMSSLYISNKRFAISKIAKYIREEYETRKDLTFGWETSLRSNELPKPIGIYLLELIACLIPVIWSMYFIIDEPCSSNIKKMSIFLLISCIILSLRNYWKYYELKNME